MDRVIKYLSVNYNFFDSNNPQFAYYLCDDIGIINALDRDTMKKYLSCGRKLKFDTVFRHHPFQVIRAYRILTGENNS